MLNALLLDIGNSALKFACYNPQLNRFLTPTTRIGWNEASDLNSSALHKAAKECERILISSVNRRHSSSVRELLSQSTSVEPIEINRHHVPLHMQVDFPDQVGIDRLLAAFAAWKLYGKHDPLIVLQVGTAVTIDVVDQSGTYQGGVILPSETTLYSSLAEKTDRLPRIEVDPKCYSIDLAEPGTVISATASNSLAANTHRIGKNTIEAMKTGVANCMLGGVEWTYRTYCKELGQQAPIIATGGGATQLANTSLPITFVSNLVLKAISMLSASIG